MDRIEINRGSLPVSTLGPQTHIHVNTYIHIHMYSIDIKMQDILVKFPGKTLKVDIGITQQLP